MKWWLIVLAILLLPVSAHADGIDSSHLGIALRGADVDAHEVIDGHLSLPAATIDSVIIRNQAEHFPEVIDADAAQALYDAIMLGKVIREEKVGAPKNNRKTDGAHIGMVLTGQQIITLDVASIINEDGVIVTLSSLSDSFAATFYAVESKELKALVLEMCDQVNFPREEVESATKVTLSTRKGFGEAYTLRATVEDAEMVRELIDIVLSGRIDHRQLGGNGALIRLDFVLPDGSIRSAYTPASDAYQTMAIGGVRLNYGKGDLDRIHALLKNGGK